MRGVYVFDDFNPRARQRQALNDGCCLLQPVKHLCSST